MLDTLKTLSPRAELYLCLSQAFRPPVGSDAIANFKNELMADFHALNQEVPLSDPHQITTLSDLMDDYDDNENFLVEYSRLFLTPSVPAPLNLGYYLDGSLYGQSTTEMESLYQKYDMERNENFKDLPDHLSLLLFFQAWGLAYAIQLVGEEKPQQLVFNVLADIQGTMQNYSLPGLKHLISKIDDAVEQYGLNAFYAELARLTKGVIERDLAYFADFLPKPESKPKPKVEPINLTDDAQMSLNPKGTVVNCVSCGKAFSHSDQMANMIAKLEADGLATDHLLVCADCRAASMGMAPLALPDTPGH